MATGRLPDPNTAPLTAKGDLYTYSTVPARLAVGSNGDTLVADSSASVGLRYQEPKAGNPVINSAFQVWQRGTSFTSATAYNADRWYHDSNTGRTVSRQTTSDTTNLPNIQFALRYQRNSGNTLTTALNLTQSFETVNSIPFVGKTVTLSFYARRGTNFSGSSNNLSFLLVSGTGTDQNQRAGYTGQALPINTTASLTTTWQRFQATGTVATTATELAIVFEYTPSGTAGADDWFEITGVQLEVGSVATPFKTQGVTLAGELAACQRYYYRYTPTTSYDTIAAFGLASSTTRAWPLMNLPVTMRTIPSSVEYSTTYSLYSLTDINGEVVSTAIAIDAASSSTQYIQLIIDVASGLTANRMYKLISASGASSGGGYIGVSAEL